MSLRESSSYGHAIAPLGGGIETGKLFHYVRREVRRVPHWHPERKAAGELVWNPNCSVPRCPERPEFVTRYLYVTGRAGRVTDRIQYCCRKHGETFAKKHGLTLAAIPVRDAEAHARASAAASEGDDTNTAKGSMAAADDDAAVKGTSSACAGPEATSSQGVQYDPWNLEHVRDRRERHRREAHGGDMAGWYDCASCGALDSRLDRLERAFRESQGAAKQ